MTAYFLRILAVSLMFAAPLQAQSTDTPEGFESFEAYEAAMYARISELAEKASLNISGLLAKRDELRAEYDAAAQRNDKAGMAEARAVQAHLIRIALERTTQLADQ
jgi:hypothetical protein